MRTKGGGKYKGSEFERDICWYLTRWIENHFDPEKLKGAVQFDRTSLSGGTKSERQAGDIKAITPDADWVTRVLCIECKFYSWFNLEHLLERKGEVLDWWRQSAIASEKVSRIPVLFFKQNRGEILFALRTDAWEKLAKELVVTIPHLRYQGMEAFVITRWFDFEQCFPAAEVKKILQVSE